MRATSIIFRREMASYFRSPVGYLFAAIALFANGIWFQSIALGENAPKMSADILARFFFTSSLVTMVLGLALSFLAIAIERSQQNTIVLLNTSPVRDLEIVLGKFFAAFLFLLVIVLVTLYIPIIIYLRGKVSVSSIAVGYVGLILAGGAGIAVGLFASATTRHWLAAAGIALIIGAVILSFADLSGRLEPPLATVFYELDGWKAHFQQSFMRGVIELKDVVYYLALTYFFLLLATKTMEAKRWQ
jgi:ABC-2 type transport system permease protein